MTAWAKLQVHLAKNYGRETMGEMLDLARAVAMEEREACAKVAEATGQEFLSPEYATGQPLSSFAERFACDQVAKAIRQRNEQ